MEITFFEYVNMSFACFEKVPKVNNSASYFQLCKKDSFVSQQNKSFLDTLFAYTYMKLYTGIFTLLLFT